MHTLLSHLACKYFYQMSRNTGTINHKITYRESYAVLQKRTNATIIPAKTMENDEEEKSLRQKSEIIYFESTLATYQKTKGQKEKKSIN